MRPWELRIRAGTVAWMRCEHPIEERQAVFDGGPTPLPDRNLCGLCGEINYLVPAAPERAPATTLDLLRSRSGSARSDTNRMVG